jgi:phosphate transport system permease protein
MSLFTVAVVLLILSYLGFRMGRSRALALSGGTARGLHSLPGFYGYYVALWCGVPAFLLFGGWIVFQPIVVKALVMADLPESIRSLSQAKLDLIYNDIRNMADGVRSGGEAEFDMAAAVDHYLGLHRIGAMIQTVLVLVLAVVGLSYARTRITPEFRARNGVELVVKIFLIASSTVAVFTTIGIVLSLLFEALRFFHAVSLTEFLFGLTWSPQTAIRADQVGSSGAFGAVPLFAGTLLISFIALIVSVPIGLMAAIYLSEYAPPRLRAVAKPALEVLAGIPTVVYGFFAALTVAPMIRHYGESIGLTVSSESALAAGFVMGIMIIPFVSSISDDVITAVPQSLREGSFGLGATRSETILQVIVPAALPGIVGGVLLAASRAIGETMIVVMAAGLSANLTANPFEAVTTVTVQIVGLLVGDQEFDSPKTLAAFALGLMLFIVTLMLNIVALTVVNKYREKYD